MSAAARAARRVLAGFLVLLALYGITTRDDLLGAVLFCGVAALVWPRSRRQ